MCREGRKRGRERGGGRAGKGEVGWKGVACRYYMMSCSRGGERGEERRGKNRKGKKTRQRMQDEEEKSRWKR